MLDTLWERAVRTNPRTLACVISVEDTLDRSTLQWETNQVQKSAQLHREQRARGRKGRCLAPLCCAPVLGAERVEFCRSLWLAGFQHLWRCQRGGGAVAAHGVANHHQIVETTTKSQMADTTTGGGGGIFRAGENMNLQILARQNLCHFLKMSEQMMYGSQKVLMRNSGHLLLLPAQILKNTEQLAYKNFCTEFEMQKF